MNRQNLGELLNDAPRQREVVELEEQTMIRARTVLKQHRRKGHKAGE